MDDMTFSATDPPSDPLVHRPVVGAVPAEPDVTAAAAAYRGQVRPQPDADVLGRTAQLAPAWQRRQAAAGRAAPPAARPEDGRGPEWERCDDIVQQLFAIGLAMQISRQLCGDRPELAARITGHMNDLQGMIQQIRSAVPARVPLRPGSSAD
jgi:hypothetical protein